MKPLRDLAHDRDQKAPTRQAVGAVPDVNRTAMR
jgi:hypothetical protein